LRCFQGSELCQISNTLAALTARLSTHLNPQVPIKDSPVKDSATFRKEIETMFEHLQTTTANAEGQENGDGTIVDSLQNLSLAIEKRRKSEADISINGNLANGEDKYIQDNLNKLERLIEEIMRESHHNR
jgi:hypothetical protein